MYITLPNIRSITYQILLAIKMETKNYKFVNCFFSFVAVVSTYVLSLFLCSPDISWGGAAGSSGCGVCADIPAPGPITTPLTLSTLFLHLSSPSVRTLLANYTELGARCNLPSLSTRCWFEDGHTLYCNSSVQPHPRPSYHFSSIKIQPLLKSSDAPRWQCFRFLNIAIIFTRRLSPI